MGHSDRAEEQSEGFNQKGHGVTVVRASRFDGRCPNCRSEHIDWHGRKGRCSRCHHEVFVIGKVVPLILTYQPRPA
jgi:hypothetical protein